MEDIMMYADDILTLCTSVEQLKSCITLIEDWSKRNGMTLNKQKSGIISFASRKAIKIPMMKTKKTIEKKKRKYKSKNPNLPTQVEKVHTEWVAAGSGVYGIPVCQKYKYLGTWLTPKLSCSPQINHIKMKSAHLFTKLYPYLSVATADGRRDMFNTMVMPLFNAATMLLKYEPSKVHEDNLVRIKRMLFKQFMRISNRTNSELVDDMIRKDLMHLANEEQKVAEEKWEARKEGKLSYASLPPGRPNALRGVPNTWCELINTQVKPCPLCNEKGKVTNRWHLKYYHQITLPHVNKIWREEIVPITKVKYREKTDRYGRVREEIIPRDEIKEKVGPVIEKHLQDYNLEYARMREEGLKLQKPCYPYHPRFLT
jgi:hypothetical protein